jgi:hypothetical protein
MGSRQIVLVSTAGISVLTAGIFWRKAKTKRLFSQCVDLLLLVFPGNREKQSRNFDKGATREKT